MTYKTLFRTYKNALKKMLQKDLMNIVTACKRQIAKLDTASTEKKCISNKKLVQFVCIIINHTGRLKLFLSRSKKLQNDENYSLFFCEFYTLCRYNFDYPRGTPVPFKCFTCSCSASFPFY